MNLLSISEPGSQTAAVPSPTLRKGEVHDDASLFALFVNPTEGSLASLLAPMEADVAPVILAPATGQPDIETPRPHGDVELPLTVAAALSSPSDLPKDARGRFIAELRTSLPPTAQARGIPQAQFDALPLRGSEVDRLDTVLTTSQKGVGEEGHPSAKLVVSSAAQSIVEGRIAQLPDVAKERMAAAQTIRAENTADKIKLMPTIGQAANASPTASTELPHSAAPGLPKQNPSSDRSRVPQERGAPQVLREEVRSVAPNNPATFIQPPATVARGLKHIETDLTEPVIKQLGHEGLQGVSSQDRLVSVAQGTGAATGVGAETARHAAHQIATAVSKGNGKTTEIALNPEELGRVRLTLTASEGALSLVVLTDRPETQELLRRHIDVLAQEFRALGYESVSFSFNAEGQSEDGDRSAGSDEDVDHVVTQNTEINDTAGPMPTTGLDLRL